MGMLIDQWSCKAAAWPDIIVMDLLHKNKFLTWNLHHDLNYGSWLEFWTMTRILDHDSNSGPWLEFWTMTRILDHDLNSGPWLEFWIMTRQKLLKVVNLICSSKIWHWINIMLFRSWYHLETFLRKSELETNSKLHYYQLKLWFLN